MTIWPHNDEHFPVTIKRPGIVGAGFLVMSRHYEEKINAIENQQSAKWFTIFMYFQVFFKVLSAI